MAVAEMGTEEAGQETTVKPVKKSALDQLAELDSKRKAKLGKATAAAGAESTATTTGTTKKAKAAKQGDVVKVLPFLLDRDNIGKTSHKMPEGRGYDVICWRGRYYVTHLAVIEQPVAMYLLNTHNPHGKDGNRPMSTPISKGYGEDMVEDEWLFAANALTFVDDDATIGDGQHQLQAIKDTGISQLFVVCYNVSKAAADYINGGKPRSTKDAMARHGHFEDYAEMWADREKLKDSAVAVRVKAHESIFSELVRTVCLRRKGLTVRGSDAQLKKKHWFRRQEDLYAGATFDVANVFNINADTRSVKKNEKTGKESQTGKGALERLAQLQYWAAVSFMASCYAEYETAADGTEVQTVNRDDAIFATVDEFYNNVADSINDADEPIEGDWSAANAAKLRRYLELVDANKAGVAGKGNAVYMVKFSAILMAVMRTLRGEELTKADLSGISINPTNIVRLDLDGVAVGCSAGLDDFAIRAASLDLDQEEEEGDEEGEDEEEGDDTDEETSEDDDEESDDDDSEEE